MQLLPRKEVHGSVSCAHMLYYISGTCTPIFPRRSSRICHLRDRVCLTICVFVALFGFEAEVFAVGVSPEPMSIERAKGYVRTSKAASIVAADGSVYCRRRCSSAGSSNTIGKSVAVAAMTICFLKASEPLTVILLPNRSSAIRRAACIASFSAPRDTRSKSPSSLIAPVPTR